MSNSKKSIEEKKSDILRIATTLFAEQGYEATTMAQIAKLANVSFGSISTYFQNKETLLHTCVEEPLKSFFQEILSFQTNPHDFKVELEQMTYRHFQLFQKHRIYLLLLVQIVAQSEKYNKPFTLANEATTKFSDALEQLITNGQKANQLHEGDANSIAVSYISLLLGSYLSHADTLGPKTIQRYSEISMRLFGLK